MSTASAAPFVFTNNTDIAVPDDDTLDPASEIEVSMPGVITRVEVQLDSITHTQPADLDVMVETPSGQFIYLMSDNCGLDDMLNDHFDFADDHANVMGATAASCNLVQQRPSDNAVGIDAWTTAPGATPVTTFAGLTGTNQSGYWKLHVADDEPGETGTITGWEIQIDTTAPDAIRIPTLGTSGTFGPLTKTVSGLPRTISDVDVQLNDLTHTFPGDLDIALESPLGTKVLFASDGCEAGQPRSADWIFDDESALAYPDDETPACNTNQRFSPRNHEAQETALGSLLGGGPFGSSLSAFDGQLANGNWKLYFNDDFTGDAGFITGYDLAITMRGAKVMAASNPTTKSKKSGKKSIKATGRVTLAGEPLTAGECAGSVKSTFQSITVKKKKGKKKVTSYKKIVSVNSNLSEKVGKCGFDFSAKLPKKYSGKKVRLITNYLGGEFIAPFSLTTTEKIKKIKFK